MACGNNQPVQSPGEKAPGQPVARQEEENKKPGGEVTSTPVVVKSTAPSSSTLPRKQAGNQRVVNEGPTLLQERCEQALAGSSRKTVLALWDLVLSKWDRKRFFGRRSGLFKPRNLKKKGVEMPLEKLTEVIKGLSKANMSSGMLVHANASCPFVKLIGGLKELLGSVLKNPESDYSKKYVVKDTLPGAKLGESQISYQDARALQQILTLLHEREQALVDALEALEEAWYERTDIVPPLRKAWEMILTPLRKNTEIWGAWELWKSVVLKDQGRAMDRLCKVVRYADAICGVDYSEHSHLRYISKTGLNQKVEWLYTTDYHWEVQEVISTFTKQFWAHGSDYQGKASILLRFLQILEVISYGQDVPENDQ